MRAFTRAEKCRLEGITEARHMSEENQNENTKTGSRKEGKQSRNQWPLEGLFCEGDRVTLVTISCYKCCGNQQSLTF